MKANVGGVDKWARILGGSFLLGLVMVGAIGSWGLTVEDAHCYNNHS